MQTQYIKALWVRSALTACVQNRYPPFNYRRVNDSTEWIQERHRFAFSKEL